MDFEYNPFSDEALNNWPTVYKELREKCPVHHFKDFGDDGFYTAAKYEDVREIFLDHSIWSMVGGDGPQKVSDDMLLSADPPVNLPFRRLLNIGLSAKKSMTLEGAIQAKAEELLAMLKPKGECDLVSDFAIPLTTTMTSELLGIPKDRLSQFRQWAEDFLASMQDTDPTAFARATAPLNKFLEETMLAHRARLSDYVYTDAARHDELNLLEQFAVARDTEGAYLNIAILTPLAAAVFIGGQGTTTSLITNLTRRLTERRELWNRLLADRSLIELAVEESLRFDPPAVGLFRNCIVDTSLRGVPVPAGAKIMGLYASANRDEDVWQNPEEFSLDRTASELRKHLAFGFGAHVCPGTTLGRLEGRIALRTLLDAFPSLRLGGEPGPRIQPFFMWSSSTLPVAWDER